MKSHNSGGGALAKFTANLDDPKLRRRIYAGIAAFLYVIGLLMLVLRVRYGYSDRRFDFANSDGKFYYAYVAGAFVDGDLSARIAYRRWDYNPPDSDHLDAFGRPLNQYPIGVSLTLIPSFVVAHAASLAMHGLTKSALFLPDGYSLPYQLINFAWMTYLVWATFLMLDRLMAQCFKLTGFAIMLAILGAWIGTQYVYHQVRFPLMSVIAGPFWATALVYVAAAAVGEIEKSRVVTWRWPAMVFCLAMAFVCRNTNAIFGLFVVYPFWVLIRAGLLGKLLRQAPLMLAGCIPILLQMCVWKYQFNHFLAVSYGLDARFYWLHPAFWQIMFSARAGMFVWVPVWALGTLGALICLRRGYGGAWIIRTYLLAFLILWYVNSSYWAWPFSNYPNRGFLELIGLPALGLGILIRDTSKSLAQRRLVLGILAAGTLFTLVMSVAYDTRHVRRYGDEVNDMGPIGARWAR
jgi:hypothetical protein